MQRLNPVDFNFIYVAPTPGSQSASQRPDGGTTEQTKALLTEVKEALTEPTADQ